MLVSHLKYLVAPVTVIALLTSCAGGSWTHTTPNVFQQNSSHARPNASCPCLYVANYSAPSVTVYASGATGNVRPIQTIAGSNTGLTGPSDVAVDASGNIYVANYEGGRKATGDVLVFAAGATGNSAPMSTIAGKKTKLYSPQQVALDSSANIYVADFVTESVTAHAAGTNGNVSPIQYIRGSRARLRGPRGVSVDGSGNIYVAIANGITNAVKVYAAGATGNVAPINTIKGSKTGLNHPRGITVR